MTAPVAALPRLTALAEPLCVVRPALGGAVGSWQILDLRGNRYVDHIGRDHWEQPHADALCDRLNAGEVPWNDQPRTDWWNW